MHESESVGTRLVLEPAQAWRVLLLLIALLLLASTLGQAMLIGLPKFPGRDAVAYVLSADNEQSLPTVFSFLLLIGCALCSLLVGLLLRARAAPFAASWLFMVGLFLFTASDELLAIHERISEPLRHALHSEGLLRYAWVLPATGLVAVIALPQGRMVWNLPAPIRRMAILSAVLFLTGAIGVEMIEGWYVDRFLGGVFVFELASPSPVYVAMFTVEEGLEMLGAALFIHATLRYLREYLGGLQLRL